jgi:hypothetical protein
MASPNDRPPGHNRTFSLVTDLRPAKSARRRQGARGGPVDENGIEFSRTVGVLYFNLLTFCEDFLALSLNLAMPPGLSVQIIAPTDRPDPSKPKYAFAMVGPVVTK